MSAHAFDAKRLRRAVILAAGASRRMGRPKAHARWGQQTFLACCVQASRHAGAEAVVAVGGAVRLEPEAQTLGVAYAHNEGWTRGPLSSLQVGLSALDAIEIRGPTLVLSIDRPHLRPDTLGRLSEAAALDPGAIWQPALGGRAGHPIIWPEDLCVALAQLPPTATPRDLLSLPQNAARRRRVQVDDPAILENLDTPEALTAAQRRIAGEEPTHQASD